MGVCSMEGAFSGGGQFKDFLCIHYILCIGCTSALDIRGSSVCNILRCTFQPSCRPFLND